MAEDKPNEQEEQPNESIQEVDPETKAEAEAQGKIPLDEYKKLRNKRAKKRYGLQMPWWMKAGLTFPFLFLIFLMCVYYFYIRNLPTH